MSVVHLVPQLTVCLTAILCWDLAHPRLAQNPHTSWIQQDAGCWAGAPPAVGTPGGSGGPSGPGGQGQPCAGQSGLVYPVSRDYTVEDPFGPRPDGLSFHDGVDIDPVPEGSPVYAAHAGTLDIHLSRQGLNGGYGYFIILTGEAGSTLYGHLTPNSATLPQVCDPSRTCSGSAVGLRHLSAKPTPWQTAVCDIGNMHGMLLPDDAFPR